MKIIENFVAVIEQVKYKQFENKNKNTKDEEPILYLCNATISEVGRGMSRFKTEHNVCFYLTKEQFDEKIIEKSDRVNILAGCKWQPQLLDYKTYDQNKIKEADKSQLKVDSAGKTYMQFKCFAYKIICKGEDSWSINAKWYDQNYCTIVNTKVKLPLESKKQFESKNELDFFLDPPEMDIISPLNGQIVKVIAYSNKNKFAEKQMEVYTEKNEKEETNYLLLKEVVEE